MLPTIKLTHYLSWFSFLFICGIALLISCSDNGGSSQQSTIEITRISPDSGAVGSRVTIYSSAIDPEHANNQVELDGIDVPILSYGYGSLAFRVPEGAASGPVTLRVNGKVANGPYFKVLTDGPVIEAITPASGGPGTQVTITGEHFLPQAMMAKISGDSTATTSATDDSLQTEPPEVTLKAKGQPSPTINGLPVSVSFGKELAPLLSLSATEVIAEVPEGATSGLITLSVDGQTATGPSFSVTADPDKQLTIEDISPKEGPVGTTVTITGANFSSAASENKVTFNGTEASVQAASTTELTATVPQGATTGAVKVTVGSQTAEGPTFTVTEEPVPQVTIEDISLKEGPVGTHITITGENFSATKAENTVTFNGTEATVQNASTTELAATVPDGTTSGPVKVRVGEQTATGPTFTITANGAPTITGEGSFEVDENTTDVGTITATDPNGDDLVFSLSGGADQDAFSIGSESGELAFTSAPDFENPADADGNNSYEIEVKVSDGTLSVTKTITVGVADVNEAPAITSGDSFEVDENSTDVGAITADDPEGDDLTYSLNGGADQRRFSIGENSGALDFKTVPDFETPRDTDRNNSYEVEVQVSDGSHSATQPVSVAVQNVPEAPTFFRGRITTNDGENYYADDPDFTFAPVPAGTNLSSVFHFNVPMSSGYDPITSASVGGPDESFFSVTSVDPDGYTIYLSGPTLEYSESPYEFTITAENAAGQSTTQTFTLPVQSPFGGGSGTESDPYQVATVEQLQAVGQNLDAHFVQTDDIDASETNSWNGGQGFKPIGKTVLPENPFTGTYDGGGNEISGLTINRPDEVHVGLFRIVSSTGTVKNVHLTGADITGERRVGVLAGRNHGTITGCSTAGTLTVASDDYGGGGLVHRNSGTIRRSHASVTVSMNYASMVGGLVGINFGTIETSYATGDVSGDEEVGGLVGDNYDGTITNSYATGAISGNITTSYATGAVSGGIGSTGGLVGVGNSSVTESYWDTESTGQSTSLGGTGLTTAEMQGTAAETNMTGFDFGGI